MSTIWLRSLVALATLFSGFLAGGNIDRYVVQVPAFRHVDILYWGQYSLHADLANGLFLYPAEAILSFLLLVAATVIALRNRTLFKPAVLPICGASILAFFGLVFTVFAAPVMLSTRTMGDDRILLQQAFDRFHYWGSFRAVVQVLSFCACIWGMAEVFAIRKSAT